MVRHARELEDEVLFEPLTGRIFGDESGPSELLVGDQCFLFVVDDVWAALTDPKTFRWDEDDGPTPIDVLRDTGR